MNPDKARTEGLWTDLPDAGARIAQALRDGHLTPEEASRLEQFARDGYAVLAKAVPDAVIDRVCADMDNAHTAPGKFFGNIRRQPVHASKASVEDKKFRFIDFHINSPAARDAIFSPLIQRFLDLVYGGPAVAFQSLSFVVGSQQRLHQDTAYVVVSRPYTLTASWIALEDVTEGGGELEYIPGSHKFPDFLFGGEHKAWVQKRDGVAANDQYIDWLYEQADKRHIATRRFVASKGDVLIWAADLAHGGARINNHDVTRRSLVTHYCPRGVLPNYGVISPRRYVEVECKAGCFLASRNYDLSRFNGHDLLDLTIDIQS